MPAFSFECGGGSEKPSKALLACHAIRYTLAPCEKHSLADILKSGVACHRFSHPGRDIQADMMRLIAAWTKGRGSRLKRWQSAPMKTAIARRPGLPGI
jgi:hypothetical protein